MFSEFVKVLQLIDKRAKSRIFVFGGIKVLLGIFDIFGIILVGALLSGLTGEVRNSGFVFLDQFSLIQIGLFSASSFLAKSLGSIYFSRTLLGTLSTAHSELATRIFGDSIQDISWTTKKYSKSELNYLLTVSPGAAIEIILGIITVISEGFLLLSILVTFLFIDAEMTLVMIVYFAVLTYGLNLFLGTKIKKFSSIQAEDSIMLTTSIHDTIDAFREIKSLNRESYFLEKFKKSKYRVSIASSEITFLNSLPKNIIEPALMLGALGLVLFSFSSDNPSESAQLIGIFLAGSLKVMSSILPLQSTLSAFNQHVTYLQILFDFIIAKKQRDKNIEVKNISDGQFEEGPIGVEISELSYRYDLTAPFALSGITLKIQPGLFTALIGPSGSGKSTIADLIIGIDDEFQGEISFFNEEKVRLENRQFRFGYVAQRPGIISGSLKQNIALGIPESEVNFEALNSSIDASHLRELVTELPDGFESDLGKQSDSLSGGQLQRIGLARALYVNPNLLILDEATSALDAETESVISDSLNELRGKCTVLVIAHRLTTVQNADLVYVIDQGKIVASGKFSELAKSNEIVAKYVELSELNA